MLMLGNQAIFLARASPKIKVFFQSFPHCDLALVSDLYFPKKLLNLLIELWELFYNSYFDKKGLTLPDLAVN